MPAIGNQDATVFPALRQDFPSARIVVIGYPYQSSSGSAPKWLLDFFSVVRRFSEPFAAAIEKLNSSSAT
jgi:hypothetical protein